MPRAFDRGIPAVDKNPLLSATNWSDPQSIIGEAAVTAGDQIRNNLVDILKGITGIDLATVPALIDSIGEEFANLIAWLQSLVDYEGLLDFLSWLWGGIEDGFAGFSATVNTALKPLIEWLSGLWDDFGDQAETFLTPIVEFLHWLWLGVQDGFAGFGATADTVLKPLLEFLQWLWAGVTGGFAGFGATADTVLKPLLVWLNWVWTQFGANVDSFLKPVFTWLKWFWDLFGASVETVLKPAFEFLEWLFGTLFADAVDTLKNIFTTLEGLLDSTGSLTSWINQIPFIGPLVSALTGKSPLDGIAMDISSIGNWARDVLTQASDIPAGKLKGTLPGAILSSIPIANINIDSLNLLSQGDFGTAGTIEAANGWTWDSSQNHTGTGGCAKVTANGTLRELFSNQVIKVVAGDRINLSAYIKTSGFSGGSSSIELSLVPFVGTSRYTVGGSPVTITFNARGAATDWALATGSAGASPVTSPWTVPATVTSVRVRLAVTAAATSGTVWFDDIDLHKTGLLGQSLVEYLLNAWENMWGGLVGTSGTGKTWADMLTAAASLRLFASGTDLNLTTLGGNLLSAPASVLGSLFSVVFDGTKTVADFLKLLYNALNKSASTTPKSADDVATAAGAARDVADLASTNASNAAGAAALAASDASDALDASTYLQTSLLTGYTVVTINSTTTWTKPANLSELYVVLFGGGTTGGTGASYSGGSPGPDVAGGTAGSAGNVVATQLDLSLLTSLSSVTVTVGTTASPITYFGSIVNSSATFANYVATPLGLMPSASLPGKGGTGGSNVTSSSVAPTAGATTLAGVGGGTAGTNAFTGVGTYTGTAGGKGSSGVLFGSLSQGGGSGGGGGGGAFNLAGTHSCFGGAGGAGGFPGGGGGGGGAARNDSYGTATPGTGGAGANGMAIIVYKIAKTTA